MRLYRTCAHSNTVSFVKYSLFYRALLQKRCMSRTHVCCTLRIRMSQIVCCTPLIRIYDRMSHIRSVRTYERTSCHTPHFRISPIGLVSYHVDINMMWQNESYPKCGVRINMLISTWYDRMSHIRSVVCISTWCWYQHDMTEWVISKVWCAYQHVDINMIWQVHIMLISTWHTTLRIWLMSHIRSVVCHVENESYHNEGTYQNKVHTHTHTHTHTKWSAYQSEHTTYI